MQWLAYFVDDKVGPCQFLNPGGLTEVAEAGDRAGHCAGAFFIPRVSLPFGIIGCRCTGGVEFRRVLLPGMVQSLRKEGSMAKGRKRMVNPCTCGCAKKDHWRGEGWCGQCGC